MYRVSNKKNRVLFFGHVTVAYLVAVVVVVVVVVVFFDAAILETTRRGRFSNINI